MGERVGVVLGTALLSGALLVAATAASAHAPWPRCGPDGAKTLAASAQVRIYAQSRAEEVETDELVSACLRSTGLSRTLSPGHRLPGMSETMWGPWALAGDWVAGALDVPHGRDTQAISVSAVNLATNERRLCHAGGGHNPSTEPRVAAVVLEPNGSVAWSSLTRQTREPSGERRKAIAVCDSLGRRFLDTGEGIDLHSLQLRGSTLTWTDAGETRSATVY